MRATIGGNEVRARDPGIGGNELLAQLLACELRQLLAGIERKIGSELALEKRGDALAGVMQRGRDDVRRLLVGDLQDEFRKIGFGDGNADLLERAIELGLFRGDALAFHHQPHFVRHQNFANVSVSVSGILGYVEVSAVGVDALLQLPQELGLIGDRQFLDLPGPVFQFVIIGKAGRGRVAIAVEGLRVVPDGGALHAERHADGVKKSFLVALVRHLARRDIYGIDQRSHAQLKTIIWSLCGP